jgi:hypothetical protein
MNNYLSNWSNGVDSVLQAGFAGSRVPNLDGLVSSAGRQPAFHFRVPVAGEHVIRMCRPPLLAPIRSPQIPKLKTLNKLVFFVTPTAAK